MKNGEITQGIIVPYNMDLSSKEIMNEVCTYFLNQKSSLSILAFPSNIIDFQPFIWNKFKVIPNYTYRINLNQSLETIQSNFDSKNQVEKICANKS